MWALDARWAPSRRGLLDDTPLPIVALLGAGWTAMAVPVAAGWLPPSALRVASITAVHAGLLVIALAWGSADGGVRLPWASLLVTVAVVAAGALAATLDPRGAILYLATPAWLAALATRGRLAGLGLGPGVALRPAVVGCAVGALLGFHLLVSASQTLGHSLRAGGFPLLGLWAYDVGANVISAECFFRGALFNRLQRRWSFGAAAALATGAALVRYLVDPLLPKQMEVMAGALFYLTLLGAVDCWLFWWSGSLAPGLCASWLFFLAYRTLSIG